MREKRDTISFLLQNEGCSAKRRTVGKYAVIQMSYTEDETIKYLGYVCYTQKTKLPVLVNFHYLLQTQ